MYWDAVDFVRRSVSERVVVRWRARFVEVVVEAAVGCCCSALDEVVAVELLVVGGEVGGEEGGDPGDG